MKEGLRLGLFGTFSDCLLVAPLLEELLCVVLQVA